MIRRGKLLKLLIAFAAVIGVLVFFYHCPFRFFFGVSCPGCGMTRALMAAVFRDFETAFYYHPLMPFLLPAGLYIALRIFCRMKVPDRRQNVYILLLAAVMILVYIARLLSHDPVVAPDFEASAVGQVMEALKRLI